MLAPLPFIPIPAMIDYVNHLARMQILAAPVPLESYVVTWQFAPNLAMDLVVPLLGRFLPIDVAARLFLAASYVLVVTGAVALEKAAKGQHQFAGLCAVPLLFSLPFAWGLTNFVFGLGIALWGLAGWIRARGRSAAFRFALHALVVVLLFIAHFFALGLYGIVLGLLTFPPMLGSCAPPWRLDVLRSPACRGALRQALVEALLLAAPLLVLLPLMKAGGGSIGGSLTDWDFALKARIPAIFLNGDNAVLASVSALVVVALIAWAVRHRDLRLTSEGRWIAVGLLLLYLVLPRRLFDVAYIDVRVLAMAGLVLPAFTTMRPWRAGAAVLVALALVNGGATVMAWSARQADYAEFRRSFASLTPGAAVLVAVAPDSPASDSALFYAPTLAAPAVDVYVASLYAFGGMQPVAPAPAFASLAVAEGLDYLPVPLEILLNGTPPPHARNWARSYDYLYVIGPPRPSPCPGLLLPVAEGARFRLYRIARGAAVPGATAPAGSEPPPCRLPPPSPPAERGR